MFGFGISSSPKKQATKKETPKVRKLEPVVRQSLGMSSRSSRHESVKPV